MVSIVKSELHHCRECWFEDIKNLRHGGYLPVEGFAENMYIEGKHGNLRMGEYPHSNSPIIETEPGIAKPEAIGDCNKL